MRRVGIAGLVALAAVLCLAGCASGTPSAEGTWGSSSTSGKPFLELAKGGVLMGSDGCNQLHGSWEQSGTSVTFGPIVSTKMACQGVDAWLTRAASARLSGSTMTVYNGSHAKIGTLPKQ